MKKKTEKYCRYCGKPFMPDKDNKNYCKECISEHTYDELTYSRKKYYRLAAKYGIDPIGMSVLDIMGLLTTTCPNCGKEFIKDYNNDVYCPECMKKERKKLKK